MTKLRPPLSFEDGLTRIAGLIGWTALARAMACDERTARAWSDPDSSRKVSMEDGLRADAAYRRAGGEGAPMLEAYALRLDIAARALPATAEQILLATARCAKEDGEAICALAHAALPGAGPADVALAIREGRQSIDAMTSALALLEGSAGGAA